MGTGIFRISNGVPEMAEYSWDIVEESWPWDETYGPNRLIEIKLGGKVVMRLAAVEAIEGCGPQFVEAHVRTCRGQLAKWRTYGEE